LKKEEEEEEEKVLSSLERSLWLSWDGHFTRDGLLLGRLLFQM
jgi:hypothetical protein